MIFKNLQQQPPDKILALMTAFKEDPRDQKLDLGVGVYNYPTCWKINISKLTNHHDDLIYCIDSSW